MRRLEELFGPGANAETPAGRRIVKMAKTAEKLMSNQPWLDLEQATEWIEDKQDRVMILFMLGMTRSQAAKTVGIKPSGFYYYLGKVRAEVVTPIGNLQWNDAPVSAGEQAKQTVTAVQGKGVRTITDDAVTLEWTTPFGLHYTSADLDHRDALDAVFGDLDWREDLQKWSAPYLRRAGRPRKITIE